MNLAACCCNPCHVSPGPVPRFENVTKVADWAYEPNPDGIAPYTRRKYDIQPDGSCLYSEDEPNATCGRVGTEEHPEDAQPVCWNRGFDRSPPENVWDVPGVLPCTGPGAVSQIIDNCYRRIEGESVSFTDPCKKMGWKGVQAKAVWPGMVGFATTNCCPDGGQQQTKYLTQRVIETAVYHKTVSSTNACDSAADYTTEIYYRVHAAQSVHVDRYGNIRRSGSVSVESWLKVDGVEQEGAIRSCNLADAVGIPSIQYSPDSKLWPSVTTFGANCGIITFGSGGGALTGTVDDLNTAEHYAHLPNQTQGACGTAEDSQYTTTGSGTPATFALSDTEISVRYNQTVRAERSRCCTEYPASSDLSEDESLNYSQVVTLSDPIYYTDVIQDAYDLLATWPLNDESIYPWRTDDATWLCPLVSRDAEARGPTIDWTQVGCAFQDDVRFSGDVRGEPLPAGYDRFYNFRHIVWGAAQPAGSWCGACEISIGEESPLVSATQWTDKLDGSSMYGPGGWVKGSYTPQFGQFAYGHVESIDGVWVQKWAETLEEWPSLNHTRPCARDRYLIDESNRGCKSTYTDPDIILDAPPAFTEFIVGDIIAFDEGVFEIVGKTDATHYELGPKKYDMLLDVDSSVSKLRFPTARAICGRLEVEATQLSPGVVQITLAENHWLKRGGSESDTVDFHSVAGLGSGLAATVVSDTVFTVPGTLGAYAGGGYVSSAGITSTTWDWDTTCPRHDFIFRSWQSQYREADADPMLPPAVLTETQHSIAPNASHPTVLCITPNGGDVFPHGLTIGPYTGFGIIAYDGCFASDWVGDFQQAITDPFWQADHEPCWHIGSGSWTKAAAPCSTGTDEYPFPPIVEARIVKPSGAPTVPVTIHIEGSMPGYIGHPNCEIGPYGRPTVHNFREAWLTCTDWQEKTNHRC